MALMIAVLWIGGVELISVGLLGEYIGCIYQEMKSRPPYEVRNTSGFASEGPAMSRSSVLNKQLLLPVGDN